MIGIPYKKRITSRADEIADALAIGAQALASIVTVYALAYGLAQFLAG